MDNKFSMGGTSTQKYLPNLDILKFVCAIIVVFYHTANLEVYGKTSLSNLREIIWFVGRFVSPVECFFIISAFFLFRKLVLLENEKGSEILKKYIFHLMVLYIIWSIPYYHYIVKNFSGRSLFHNLASLVYQYAVTGYSLQTWYIPSLCSV